MLNPAQAEQSKYERMWAVPEYDKFSPGMENVDRFIEIVKPNDYETLIDIGCGAGRAGLRFQNEYGLRVWWMDITDAGLDPAVPREMFSKQEIWGQYLNGSRRCWDYGYCCDVMEHIPTEYTMLVLDRIINACRVSYFQICLVPDQFGARIGEPLHLTVRPFTWWRDRLNTIGNVVDARDLLGNGLYVVERK